MPTTLYVGTNFKRRTRSHAMRTVSAQTAVLDSQVSRTFGQEASAGVRSVALEGIAVTGRDSNGFGIRALVLLLLIAILPG